MISISCNKTQTLSTVIQCWSLEIKQIILRNNLLFSLDWMSPKLLCKHLHDSLLKKDVSQFTTQCVKSPKLRTYNALFSPFLDQRLYDNYTRLAIYCTKIIRFGNSGLPLCVSILEQTIGFVNNEMQVSIGCVYRRGQKLLHLKGVTMMVARFNNTHRLTFSFTNVVLPFICVSFLVKREWEKTNAIYLIFVTDTRTVSVEKISNFCT